MATLSIFHTTTGFLKVTEIVMLITIMAMVFAYHNSWIFYVASSFIGAFVHTVFLLIIYSVGGVVIQKTLWEVLLNAYNGLMLIISSIVIYCNSKDSLVIAAGSISILVGLVFFLDTYVALRNTGALSPALGGNAPPSATGPTSTSRNPDLQMPAQPNYPSPLGVNNTTTTATTVAETPATTPAASDRNDINNNDNVFDPPTSSYVTPPTSPERSQS